MVAGLLRGGVVAGVVVAVDTAGVDYGGYAEGEAAEEGDEDGPHEVGGGHWGGVAVLGRTLFWCIAVAWGFVLFECCAKIVKNCLRGWSVA